MDNKVDKQEREELTIRAIEHQKQLFQAMQGVEMPEWLGSELTMPQFKIVFLLYTHGWMRMGGTEKEPGIAFFLGKNISTATGIVDRLVEQKLMQRKEDPYDRRVVVVGLTPSGVELCETFLQNGWKNVRSMLNRLTLEELRHVERGMEIMTRVAMEDANERASKHNLARPDTFKMGRRLVPNPSPGEN